jgi:hypothetical protein
VYISFSFRFATILKKICDSSVGIATGGGLDDRGVGVRFPVGSRISVLRVVQIDSGAHPASYPMGTGGLFRGGKAAGVRS